MDLDLIFWIKCLSIAPIFRVEKSSRWKILRITWWIMSTLSVQGFQSFICSTVIQLFLFNYADDHNSENGEFWWNQQLYWIEPFPHVLPRD